MARLKISDAAPSAHTQLSPLHSGSEAITPHRPSSGAIPKHQPLRPFGNNHADSMQRFSVHDVSLHVQPVSSCPLHDANQITVRATPRRNAKAAVDYRAWQGGSPQASDEEVSDSEWPGSCSGTESDATDDDVESLSTSPPCAGPHTDRFRSAAPARILQRKQPKDETEIVDLTTSPAKPKPMIYSKVGEIPSRTHRLGDNPPSPGIEAIIKFSPPRLKSPFKKPPLPIPPPHQRQQQRSTTPPPSPFKSELTSPRKAQYIPPTPHRPSIDAFWSQEVVNSWNDQHSPSKTLASPRKIPLPESDEVGDEDDNKYKPVRFVSPSKAAMKMSPVKMRKESVAIKKAFEKEKFTIAANFLREVDDKISHGGISKLAEDTGGVQVVWNKKLNSTAGRANWRREVLKTKGDDGSVMITYRHKASIELAEKVIDDENRLLNVIAHEYCHLANFMISNIRDQPHGASFKRWAALVSATFADRGIQVTTKHSYEINYKYAWACTQTELCGMQYERHSKSIDPSKQSCGKCKSRLVQIRPVPKGAGTRASASAATLVSDHNGGKVNSRTEYQSFVKEHFGQVRNDLGIKSPMKDIMRELGVRYRSWKETSTKEENSIGNVCREGKQIAITSTSGMDVVVKKMEIIEIASTDGEEDDHVLGKAQSGAGEKISVDKVSRVLDFLSIHDD